MGPTDHQYRCTSSGVEAAARIDADRTLAARVVDTGRTEHGVRVRFAPGAETAALVDTFVANESRCCGFFDFVVTRTARAVTLEITAPSHPSAQQLVEAAREMFDLGPDAIERIPTGRAEHA